MNRLPQHHLAEDIIRFLRASPDTSFPFASLAGKLSVSIEEITSGIAVAERWGYSFSYSGNTVRFQDSPDMLTDTELQYGLQTSRIGHEVYAYQKVKSTNDIARELAESGAEEGAVVTAEEQTRGRGRLGREWHSPPGRGVYLSIILRPPFPPEKAPGISLLTALALAETASQYCPGLVQIKWPNDVLINNKKTAGILTELSAEKTAIYYLVVGVGINVNHTKGDFPPELQHTATSIALESKRSLRRVLFVQQFLVSFENMYNTYNHSCLRDFLPALRAYSSLLGKQVTLTTGRKTITGIARDINHDGALLVACDNRLITVSSGEVTVVKR